MVFNKYKVFVTVAETEHMGKAAKMLQYTPQGISRIIKSLEDEVGLRLVVKGRDGIRLTQEAKEILPEVKQIVEKEDCLFAKIDTMKSTDSEQQIIKVGVSTLCGTEMIETLYRSLAEYCKENGAKLELRYNSVENVCMSLRQGKIDCALLPEEIADEFSFKELTSIKYVAVFPEESKLAKKKEIELMDLNNMDIAIHSDSLLKNQIISKVNYRNLVVTENENEILNLVSQWNMVGIGSSQMKEQCDNMRPIKNCDVQKLGFATRRGEETLQTLYDVIKENIDQ